LSWFEKLYQAAAGDESVVPWADFEPNPHLVSWHRKAGFDLTGRRCLKIGCGLGDDSEYLALSGAGSVVAFDISPTAVAWARRRFPSSKVRYEAVDLFQAPREWEGAFDFVLESYTLQVLPAALRADAIGRIAAFVAPKGTLLVICRGRDQGDPEGAMPWPLLREELGGFGRAGLTERSFEDFYDTESPPVRRLRVVYERL
jgi:SAM-dependent methyltransferase